MSGWMELCGWSDRARGERRRRRPEDVEVGGAPGGVLPRLTMLQTWTGEH